MFHGQSKEITFLRTSLRIQKFTFWLINDEIDWLSIVCKVQKNGIINLFI